MIPRLQGEELAAAGRKRIGGDLDGTEDPPGRGPPPCARRIGHQKPNAVVIFSASSYVR
jgi:hypothetical protein